MKDTKTTLKLADLTWLNSHLISQVQLTDCQTCCSLPVRVGSAGPLSVKESFGVLGTLVHLWSLHPSI